MSEGDLKVLTCNYLVGTKICGEGAKAYVLNLNYGNAMEEIWLLARSHGGRLVIKWERAHRLHNFRLTTIPSQKPIYGRLEYAVSDLSEKELAAINKRADDIRAERHRRIQKKADAVFAAQESKS